MSEEPFEHTALPEYQSERMTADLLRELKPLASPELFQCVQKIKEDYLQKMPENLTSLCDLIKVLNKQLKPPTSQESHLWNWPWPRAKLKVFPVVASKTFDAHNKILNKIQVEVCSNPEDCEAVVLFCPVISRVGSDVNDAMRKIPGEVRQKPVILVVMHHTRTQDINPTEAQLNHGHQNVIRVVHVVFHETVNGLLKCERNNKAIEELEDLCKHLNKE